MALNSDEGGTLNFSSLTGSEFHGTLDSATSIQAKEDTEGCSAQPVSDVKRPDPSHSVATIEAEDEFGGIVCGSSRLPAHASDAGDPPKSAAGEGSEQFYDSESESPKMQSMDPQRILVLADAKHSSGSCRADNLKSQPFTGTTLVSDIEQQAKNHAACDAVGVEGTAQGHLRSAPPAQGFAVSPADGAIGPSPPSAITLIHPTQPSPILAHIPTTFASPAHVKNLIAPAFSSVSVSPKPDQLEFSTSAKNMAADHGSHSYGTAQHSSQQTGGYQTFGDSTPSIMHPEGGIEAENHGHAVAEARKDTDGLDEEADGLEALPFGACLGQDEANNDTNLKPDDNCATTKPSASGFVHSFSFSHNERRVYNRKPQFLLATESSAPPVNTVQPQEPDSSPHLVFGSPEINGGNSSSLQGGAHNAPNPNLSSAGARLPVVHPTSTSHSEGHRSAKTITESEHNRSRGNDLGYGESTSATTNGKRNSEGSATGSSSADKNADSGGVTENNPMAWSEKEVGEWLIEIGCGQYAQAAAEARTPPSTFFFVHNIPSHPI